MTKAYGFENEILVVISEFDSTEARLMQAIDVIFKENPANGRVEQSVAVIISKDNNIYPWLKDYIARNPQGRSYVGISWGELISSNDSWYVRRILSKQMFSRDLFDYTLPVNEDLFFIGRQSVIGEHIDAIKKSENRGLFGLRKTGKTSVLFKIMRHCLNENIIILYYDCKFPALYSLRYNELINKLIIDINEKLGRDHASIDGGRHPSEKFLRLIENLSEDKRICIIFDEIEYISGGNKYASHWKEDFVPFWQTFWSIQSQHRKFSFIISGVNASIVEQNRIEDVQNPVFGIVKYKYLMGFEKEEVHSLLSTIGRRMGLKFEQDAVDMLYKRYGGHPLLTRIICSQISNEYKERPCKISSIDVKRDIKQREIEIEFYCNHIASELKLFYPDEYEMLEMLASDSMVDFNELSVDSALTRHLRAYGLVDFTDKYVPSFKIPVIRNYILSEWKKKNNIKTDRYLTPQNRRQVYVRGRLSAITGDIRIAERIFQKQMLPSLYGGFGPAEAELFTSLEPVCDRNEAASFLNQCSKSLIEPIDASGVAQSKKSYFYNEVKNNYGPLWESLNRVRVYRNYLMHGNLNEGARKYFDEFIVEDFGGLEPGKIEDGWFQMQSIVLDKMIIGIQSEISKYN